MNAPKRHHYVPRFLLSNFSDEDGMMCVLRQADRKIWRAAPENVFVEQHRYSTFEEDGTRDPRLERQYADLEQAAAPICEALIMAARDAQPVLLSDEHKRVWDAFFYHQMKRVPAMSKQLAAKQDWSSRLEAAITTLAERGISPDEETLTKLRSHDGLAQLAQNATVKALATSASDAVDLLLGCSALKLGVAPPGAAFVIGDRPIANRGLGLASQSRMWLPLAPDVAVRPDFGGTPTLVVMTRSEVGEVNAAIAAQSEQIAGQRQADIAQIAAGLT